MAASRQVRHQPGRLEPFLAVSLLLHAALVAVLPRWLIFERPVLPMARGAVVQVVAVPAPASPAAATRPQPPSAPGGAGLEPSRRLRPAAAQVVSDRPEPQRPPEKSRDPAGGPSASVPRLTAVQPSRAADSAERRITSERSPTAARAAAPRSQAPEGPGARERPGEAGSPATGPITRPGSTGTSGVDRADPQAGPAEPVPASAVVAVAGAPHYPKNAISQGLEGRVVLELTVGADGALQEAAVKESSGRAELDTQAVRYVRSAWRLKPAPARLPYRIRVEFTFSIHQDRQGRMEPAVAFRLLSDRIEYVATR